MTAAPQAIAGVFSLLARELAVDCVVALDCGFAREPELPFEDERFRVEAALFDRFDVLLVWLGIRPPS